MAIAIGGESAGGPKESTPRPGWSTGRKILTGVGAAVMGYSAYAAYQVSQMTPDGAQFGEAANPASQSRAVEQDLGAPVVVENPIGESQSAAARVEAAEVENKSLFSEVQILEEPVVMTADDPKELVNQFYSNYYGAQNATSEAELERFISYMTGNVDTGVGQVYLGASKEIYDYRATNPSYKPFGEARVLDSKADINSIEVIVQVIPDSPQLESYVHYLKFSARNGMSISDPQSEIPVQAEWLATETLPLEDNQTSFAAAEL